MSDKPLTGLEKAALLLKSLPPEVSEKVMRHVEPRHAARVSSELVEVSKRPDLNEVMSRVLDEALEVLNGGKPEQTPAPVVMPPPETPAAPTVDVRVGDDKEKKAPAFKLAIAEGTDPVDALASVAPDVLSRALDTENARTVALLMNRMEIDAAGQIFKRLSQAKRKEVSARFTEQGAVNDMLLQRIAQAVLTKCRTLAEAPAVAKDEKAEREKRMASLLRELERADRVELLATLEESDPELTARLKSMLYTFEDILLMENSSIQKLLSEIDMKTLSVALRGAPQEIHERITSNLSRRAQESLKEEIELSGNIPAAKVKEGRKMIEEAILRLDQREELVMMEKS